jgi:GNAT superfamily N-acetyltransferase
MRYRIATENDLLTLAMLRWDFRTETTECTSGLSQADFIEACVGFLREGLMDKSWTYWVAEAEGELVSQIFIKRIRRVPKPNRLHDEYGYVTNVYTRPAFRGQGIGSELMRHVLAWAREQDIENLIVWPAEESIPFYERAGFTLQNEVMEYQIRPPID